MSEQQKRTLTFVNMDTGETSNSVDVTGLPDPLAEARAKVEAARELVEAADALIVAEAVFIEADRRFGNINSMHEGIHRASSAWSGALARYDAAKAALLGKDKL